MPWSCSLGYISSPLTSHLPMCLYAATACCYLCLLSHRLFVLASRLLLFPSPFSLRSFLHVKDEFFPSRCDQVLAYMLLSDLYLTI